MANRITNMMMTNTTLTHINRNMRNLGEIIRTIETTKRVSRPSDDPIVAGRALKFRTSVQETLQFQRNVDNGLAWMNVTESAFTNINQELLYEVRALLVSGANDPYNTAGRRTLATQIQSLFNQVGSSINHNFAGRYLFSGLRTNEPPMFKGDNNRHFVITQHFSLTDIEHSKSFQRLTNPYGFVEPYVNNINVIKLAFAGLDTQEFTTQDSRFDHFVPPPYEPINNPTGIHIPGFQVVKISRDHPLAYRPHYANIPTVAGGPGNGLPIIHFIPETGELVMHPDVSATFPRDGISVTYSKQGFRQGDINPAVYFDAREIIDVDPANAMPNIDRVYQITQFLSSHNGTGVNAAGESQIPRMVPDGSGGYFQYEEDDGTGTMVPVYDPIPASAVTHFQFTLSTFDSTFGAGAPHDVPYLGNGTNGPAGLIPTMFGRPLPHSGITINTTMNPGVVSVPSHMFNTNDNISIQYHVRNPIVPPGGPNGAGSTHIKNDLRIQNAQLVRALDANGIPVPLDQAEVNHSFDMNNQNMYFEFATNTRVAVNSLAKNSVTDKMFADFRRFFEMVDAMQVSDEATLRDHFYSEAGGGLRGAELEQAIETQISHEYSQVRAALQVQFDSMLRLVERHLDQTGREQTQLGARMVRLELIQDRLEQDYVSYNRLTSNNEDTDMIRAIILRASAEATFAGSLQANVGLVQISLAQFVR